MRFRIRLIFVLMLLHFQALSTFADEKKIFRSSSLDMACNYDKLSRLLSMDVDELILDEDFVIDRFRGRLYTDIPRIVGKDVNINVTTDITVNINNKTLPEIFIQSKAAVEYIGGLDFNFNNHACRTVLAISNTSSEAEVEDISFNDMDVRNYPLEQQTYIMGLYVKLSDDSDVKIRNISAKNLYSTANKIIGDSCGNISAVYITGAAGVQAHLEIYDSQFSNIHNYDDVRNIILEDTNGIYVSLGSPVSSETKVHIHDITGVDYGKRLIKTDCSNLLIENITASSKYYDTLSAISLNDGDGKEYNNAVIDNVRFTGITQYVVGSSVPDTRITDVYSEITIAPKSYVAAIMPSAGCQVENLTLRGAQLIAAIVNTPQKIHIGNVDYDDTMYAHNLYGSSLFLTKEADIELTDLNIRSDKLSFLFFDNYSNQTGYSLNVKADIDNMTLTLLKDSKDWFLRMSGDNHIWDLNVRNSKIIFEGMTRGLIGISPKSDAAKRMSLSIENMEVVYNQLNPQTTIPFGYAALGNETRLSIKDLVVYNNSGKDFSKSLRAFYLKNLTGRDTYDRVYIERCNIDNCKTGLSGVEATGNNVIWAGGDSITHSAPETIVSLSRKHKKFSYRDDAGTLYRWSGRKWKIIKQ